MAADRRAGRRRLGGVRVRTTMAATVIVGVALAVTAVGLIGFLRHSLVEQVDEIAYARAADVAALARQGALPADLAVAGDDGHITQVVDDTGRVVATTAPATAGQPVAALTVLRPEGSRSRARTVDPPPPGGTAFRVVALRTATPGGPVTVYVASALEPVEETTAALERALAVGAPVLLVLVAFTTWALVGRALRPVDAIGAQVADISDRSLDRRVPVPPTGDEIARLAGLMNTMLDRLQSAAERQRRFVADASHELQTPLAAMRVDLEVALAHPDRTDLRRTVADVLAANRRLALLVKDLLFLARADGSVAPPPAVPVDLDDVVLSETARVRGDGEVRIDTRGVSAAAVAGRREELARVVRNLLDNAERHASTLVTVELASADGHATLVVTDDGPGIAVTDRERIFERFTTADDARSGAGTGLGLAIAREIVVAHGGTVAVHDSPRGARLVVRLPAR
jgi:signal transduction histidine kinase